LLKRQSELRAQQIEVNNSEIEVYNKSDRLLTKLINWANKRESSFSKSKERKTTFLNTLHFEKLIRLIINDKNRSPAFWKTRALLSVLLVAELRLSFDELIALRVFEMQQASLRNEALKEPLKEYLEYFRDLSPNDTILKNNDKVSNIDKNYFARTLSPYFRLLSIQYPGSLFSIRSFNF
jgi:hypothetical protein